MKLVIKLGSQVLLDERDGFSLEKLSGFVHQIIELKKQGHDVVLVSSGALATGRSLLINRNEAFASKQVLASIGQAELIHSYNDLLKKHGFVAAQLLVSKEDFKTRERYLNIRDLFESSFKNGSIIPIVNENDPVTTTEKSFTDNDELSSLVAAQIKAQKLIILTGAQGVFDKSPEDPDANLLKRISPHDKNILSLELNGGSKSGRGGIRTKLDAALNASEFGIQTHIAAGSEENVILRLVEGEEIGTLVEASQENPNTSFKRWLATDVSQVAGAIIVNKQLSDMINRGDTNISILPVGIKALEGTFVRDDLVKIKSSEGEELGQGVARYDSETLSGYLEQQNKPVFIRENKLYLQKGSMAHELQSD